MARNLEHLELPQWQQALPRRKRGGGKAPVRTDRQAHGRSLVAQAEQVTNRLQQRKQSTPQGINPKFVFKLQLHPQGNLDERQLSQIGLRMLARDPRKAIVVFPDDDAFDATMADLLRRLKSYAREERYSSLASIEAIENLTSDDRIGSRLRANPLLEDEVAPLDLELWHSGDIQECRRHVAEIELFLREQNLRVTDRWIGENLCLLRAKVNALVLPTLLDIDYIKEIDRRSEPSFEMLDVARLDISQVEVVNASSDDLVGILVVDSGVMQQHPLIAPALGDAQVFPDRLRNRIVGGAEDGDEKSGGHGTAVAGIAIYSDVGECIATRSFQPSARLFSARVTDDQNEYDEDDLLEHQLEQAVDYFLGNYPSVKVINISLGDWKYVYSDGSYQFRFAAAIDEMAYRHRDREIVFVVSAGNFFPDHLSDEELLSLYPAYLLESKESRIISPATSALSLTVGGLSYGAGKDVSGFYDSDTIRLVAGEKGWPSPFTRTGWGVDGAVKPEVVDFAGDLRFERGSIPNRGTSPTYAGLPSIAKNYQPPGGRLFRTVSGTSFAAPRVANLAARLFESFPNASSNLVRALIADSSRVPLDRPPAFAGKEDWDSDLLRVYGYGQPDFARARWSDTNATLLLADGLMELDSFQIFTIPSLPENFRSARGNGYISVTLAFDPPTRPTRGDSYLGVSMEFLLFRNATPEQIEEALKVWDREEKEDLEDAIVPALGELRKNQIKLNPGTNVRKKGTLQRGLHQVSTANWKYDGDPLYLAAICQRKWAPVEITSQRFAIVASLVHENPDVNIYAHVQQQTRISQRVRLRT